MPKMNHNCSNECVKDEVDAKKDPFVVLTNYSGILKYNESPFAVPFEFGWKKDYYSYSTPCGKTKYKMSEIRNYLSVTRSHLSIEQFTFCQTINFSPLQLQQNKVICEDVSCGQENLPIQVVNDVDDDQLPHFNYVTKYIPYGQINLNSGFVSCCSCTNGCIDSSCECRQLTYKATKNERLNFRQKYGYDTDKLLSRPYTHGLYECNDQCLCSKTACYNRLTREGIKSHLQVYKDPQKGWSVRCLHDLPFGAFICSYTGEVMNHFTCEDISTKRGDEYVFQLSLIETIEQKEGYESDVSDNLLDQSLYEGEDDAVSLDIDNSSCASSDIKVDFSDHSDEEQKDLDECSSISSGPKQKKFKKDAKVVEDEQIKSQIYIRARKYFAGKIQPLIIKVKKKCEGAVDANVKTDNEKQDDQVEDEDDEDSLRETYVVDAKVFGNIGRFFNHSCDPNCHVQTVFTDTHDPRFHSLAVFAMEDIKAGTELTIDYYYIEKGSFQKCFCDSSNCRLVDLPANTSSSSNNQTESPASN